MIDSVTNTVVLVNKAGHVSRKGVNNSDFLIKFIEISLKFCRFDFLECQTW